MGFAVVALTEGLVYRVVLLEWLRSRRVPDGVAVAISGLLGSIPHVVNGSVSLTVVASGLFLAYSYVRTRNFWVALALHGVIVLVTMTVTLMARYVFGAELNCYRSDGPIGGFSLC